MSAYGVVTGLVERVLRVPPAPDAPPGDEGSTRVFRASPRYFQYRLLTWALSQCIALLGLLLAVFATRSATTGSMLSAVALPFLLVEIAFSYAAMRLDYEKRWYLVTDRSLRIRQGVVRVSEMTISFANIQNISISQGPLQRMLGIADLRVDTAGGGGAAPTRELADSALHTAFFRGVDNAERIRTLMQDRLRGVRDTGLGDPDDAAHAAASRADENSLALLRQVRAAARELRSAAEREPDTRAVSD